MKKTRKTTISLLLIILVFGLKSSVFAATSVTGSGAFFNFQDPTLFNSSGNPPGYAPDGSLGVLDITTVADENINYDINVYEDGNSSGTPDPDYSVTGISRSILSLDLMYDTGGFPPLTPGFYYAQNYQIRNNSPNVIHFTFQGGIATGDLQTELDQWLWSYGASPEQLTTFTLYPGESSPIFATVFGMTPASTAQNLTGNLVWAWNFTTASSSFTVNFDSQGGSDVAGQEVSENNPFVMEPEIPTKDGYRFIGWYTGPTASDQPFDFSQAISGDLTLYAIWEANPSPTKWTVTFDSQGGSQVLSQIVADQSLLEEPSAPIMTGHTFRGWYEDPEGGVSFNFQSPISQNMTLYAIWEKTTEAAPTPDEHVNDSDKKEGKKISTIDETNLKNANNSKNDFLPHVGESSLNLESLILILLTLSSLLFFKNFKK